MDILPPELVIKILSFLDPEDIIICRQVCLRWRILSSKLTNPLYLPFVIGQILQTLQGGRLRDLLKLRLVCKLWKGGLDNLTHNQAIYLKGVTSLDSRSANSLIGHSQWNPFPSRIVRVKLCHGHGDPETSGNPLENQEQNLFMEHFGKYVHHLQVSLEHAKCAELHLVKVLNYVKNLKGLVVSESPSPFRFVTKDNSPPNVPNNAANNLSILETLNYLKLDDLDSKLKYSELYAKLIENAANLTHLELNGYHHLDMGIVRLLSDRQPVKLNLTKLKIDAEDPYLIETFEILNQAQFQLKYLSLKINGFGNKLICQNCAELLHSFLTGAGESLERLELKLSWYDKDLEQDNCTDKQFPEILSSFPSSKYLPKLERFKLVGYRGSLDFLRDFPSLKYLMIVNYNSPKEDQGRFKNEDSFHSFIPTLKEMYLLTQQALQSENAQFKEKVKKFMYERDSSFIPKYCGLYEEGFP